MLGGLGLGLIYLPAIVSVGFYFESRRALATGISGTIHHLVNVTSYKENSDQTKKILVSMENTKGTHKLKNNSYPLLFSEHNLNISGVGLVSPSLRLRSGNFRIRPTHPLAVLHLGLAGADPRIFHVLLLHVSLQVATLVLAGLCLVCLLCGAVMRPLDQLDQTEQQQQQQLSLQLPDGTRVQSSQSFTAPHGGLTWFWFQTVAADNSRFSSNGLLKLNVIISLLLLQNLL